MTERYFDLSQGARLGQGGYIPQLSLDQSPLLMQSVPSSIPLDAPQQGGQGWSWLDTFNPDTGAKTGQGMAGMAFNAASGIFDAYMGMKKYGLMKDQFAESKRQFGLNFDAQRRLTNASLADRQRARLSTGGNYQSVGDYMGQYGIPGG